MEDVQLTTIHSLSESLSQSTLIHTLFFMRTLFCENRGWKMSKIKKHTKNIYNSERFEPRWVNVVVWVIVRVCSVVLRRTVVGVDWRLMMASAQVVETSVNTNNSPSQDYTTNPDDHSNHNTRTYTRNWERAKNYYFGYCTKTWKWFVSRLTLVCETSPTVLCMYNFVSNPFCLLLYFLLAGKG